MSFLRNLYERSEGFDVQVDYDTIVEKFRCTSYEVPDPCLFESRLLSCSFARKAKNGHILAASCENGQIIILNTKQLNAGLSNYCQISEAHNNALFSASWSEIDMKLVTTSGDHSVNLWDVSDDCTLKLKSSFRGHRCSVKTACFKPQSCDIFASGSRDGNIYVWDSRTKSENPEQNIMNCHPKVSNKKENASVTWLIFQDESKLISCADVDTNIKVWDLRKTYLKTMEKPIPLYQLPSPKKNSLKGYSHMVLNRNATRLYASSFNNVVYNFNVSTYSAVPDYSYSGHTVNSCYDKISLSPDERYLASIDNSYSKIFIWGTSFSGEPLVMLGGQLEGLSDVSWCPENELMIATSSDHPFPWIWTIPPTDETEENKSEVTSQSRPLSQCLENGEDADGPISFAKRLRVRPTKKSKRVSAMATSFKHTEDRLAELASMLTFPNAVVDGYQIHVCVATEKHRDSTTNWLTNMQNEKFKKIVIDKQRKGIKRKKSTPTSPGNNLNKYFRRHNQNFDTINVTDL